MAPLVAHWLGLTDFKFSSQLAAAVFNKGLIMRFTVAELKQPS